MVGLESRRFGLFVLLFILCAFSVSSQTYNRSMIDAVLISPKFGASQVDRFDLIINVSEIASCRYSLNPELNYSQIISPVNQFSASGKTQKIIDFQLSLPEGETRTLYVVCSNLSNGYVNNGFPIPITLSIDKTEPKMLSAVADPSFVIENARTVLTVTLDDESYCKFDRTPPTELEFKTYFDQANLSYFNKTNAKILIPPVIEDNREYTYTVSCMNRAGIFASELKTINFKVNLSAANTIVRTLPKGYVKSADAEILVETNRDSTCRYALDSTDYASTFPQEHKKIHFIQKQNLEDKKTYTYNVRCEFDQGNPSVLDTAVTFIIDRLPPRPISVQADSQTCTNTSLSATFLTNDTDLSGVYYRILDSKNAVIKGFTFSTALQISLTNLSLVPGEKYFWEVFGTDSGGNNGTSQKSLGTLILNKENAICLPNLPPSLNKIGKITEIGVSLTLECKDDDGCKGINYLLINSKNPLCSCSSCNYTLYDLPLFGINENSSLCYKLMDNKNLTKNGQVSIKLLDCQGNETGCCGGKKSSLCEENCTAVEQVECNPERVDSDGDSMSDVTELKCGLNPNNSTDALADSDKDGLTNKDECINYNTNITKADTDGDTYSDKEEIEKTTSPINKNDFPKDLKKDSDGDLIPDYKEKECGLDINKKDAGDDNDDDHLTNKEECLDYKTNLEEKDTDGDKVSDKAEVDAGTDPNDETDYPKSPLLTIILVIVLIGIIGAVAYLFVAKKKDGTPLVSLKLGGKGNVNQSKQNMFNPYQQNKYNPNAQKFNVDFNQAKKDMHTEVVQLPVTKKDNDDLDFQIKKKKEMMRLRQMSSIFDEFGHDVETPQIMEHKKEELLNKQNKERANVFQRLDDLSKGSSFEEVQKIKKKKREEEEEN